MRGLLLLAWGLLLALVLGLAPGPVQAQVLRIDRALTATGAGAQFPGLQPTSTVELPDEWARTRPGFEGALWYRARFQAPPLDGNGDPLVLYIEQV